MKLRVLRKCGCGAAEEGFDCGGYDIFIFMTKPFQIRWFLDNGEWFFYLHIGLRVWRWSSAGFIYKHWGKEKTR